MAVCLSACLSVYLPVGMPVYLYVCFSFIASLFGSLSTLRNARKTIQMFSQQLCFFFFSEITFIFLINVFGQSCNCFSSTFCCCSSIFFLFFFLSFQQFSQVLWWKHGFWRNQHTLAISSLIVCCSCNLQHDKICLFGGYRID